ncbi:gluconate 2-dehydrogenase|nr:gluconate 2-dehydrogenase [Candidatus Pantoea persica]
MLGVAASVTHAVEPSLLKVPQAGRPSPIIPPETLDQPGWLFLTPQEAKTLEAIVDRLIPADELSVGGKEAGCAQFIDRQLHGFYCTFK